MKNYILLLTALLALSSCHLFDGLTRDERIAQRKLRKAIKHDPNIISKQYTDTLIKGFTQSIRVIKLDAQEARSRAFSCDSIFDELDKAQRALIAKGDTTTRASLFLYKDSAASISVRKEGNNKLSVAYRVNERIVHDTAQVPYEVQVRVPGKLISQYKAYPCWHYIWFWLLLTYALVTTYLTCMYIRDAYRARKQLANN